MDAGTILVIGLGATLFTLLLGAGLWLSMLQGNDKPEKERAGALADRQQSERGITGWAHEEAEYREDNPLPRS